MHQEQFAWASDSNGAGQVGPRREELRGDVGFASEEEQATRTIELLGAGALLVTVPPPQRDARGRLGEVLEELVERELARAGAPSPYLAAWSAMPEDAQARLADQLFRVRTLGATGLAIAMGSLGAIATPTLTTDDSATLRWLAEATESAPLVVLLDDSDLMLLGYEAPRTLAAILARRDALPEAPPSREELTDIQHVRTAEKVTPVDPAELPQVVVDTLLADTDSEESQEETHEDPAETAAEPEVAATMPEPEVAAMMPEPEAPAVVPEPAAPAMVPEPEPAPVRRRASVGVPVSGPDDAWRSWAIALTAARGPQPLAAFERLFAESYVPLANAIACGVDDPRATRAFEEFRRSFERSYSDAFAAFGATNRRPRLVMDAYDIAAKNARLANARSAHVLVVDSMRFDLGCLVRDALARATAGAAMLTSEALLWSALPTTTIRQLETFARGIDALRDPSGTDRDEPMSLRGRAAEVVRRLRVGSRELYKLDIVRSMLEASPNVLGSFGDIAEATAEAIARHLSTLPPRTLLLVVGDHGFGFDRRGELQTGGASPEEVLVPAFSWLVGDLH